MLPKINLWNFKFIEICSGSSTLLFDGFLVNSGNGMVLSSLCPNYMSKHSKIDFSGVTRHFNLTGWLRSF